MARPKRDGLLYFSLDTDFFYADRRIRALKTRFGSDGIVFYIYLLTEIYRDGYCTRWNTDSMEAAMDELGFTEGLIEQIMTFLVSRSLLSKSILADSDTIITSPGIQKRYQEAAKSLRRDVIVDPDIWLLEEEKTADFIKFGKNPDKYSKNPDKYSENESKYSKNHINENKGNKNKGNENKGNENKGKRAAAGTQQINTDQMISERHFPPELDAAVREWVSYKAEKRQRYRTTGFRNFLSQVENNVREYGEAAVVDLIKYCMAQNWQGVIFDRLAEGKHGGRRESATDKNGIAWPIIGGVDWSKV